MEESQKKLIQDNFFKLISNTTCSYDFLLRFKSQRVFTVNDIKSIMTFKDDTIPMDLAYQFYRRILLKESNPDIFKLVVSALKDTNQLIPYAVLVNETERTEEPNARGEQVANEDTVRSSATNFQYLNLVKEGQKFKSAPHNVIQLLTSTDLNLLLLECHSVEITTTKILDTIKNAEIVQDLSNVEIGKLFLMLAENEQEIQKMLEKVSSCKRLVKVVILHDSTTNNCNMTFYGKDSTFWDELTSSYQKELIEKLEGFCGEEMKIDPITEILVKNELSELLAAEEKDKNAVLGEFVEEYLKYKSMDFGENLVFNQGLGALWRIALPHVFPSNYEANWFKNKAMRSQNFALNNLVGGILRYNGTYEFVNYYVAHYCMAKFIVTDKYNTLADVPYQIREEKFDICNRSIKTYEFVHKTLICLLDFLVKQNDQTETHLWNFANFNVDIMASACMRSNFDNLLKDLLFHKVTKFNGEIIMHSIKFGNEKTTDLVFEKFKYLKTKVRTFRYDGISLLHAAVERGSLHFVKKLMEEYCFVSQLGKPEMRNLIHFCVTSSLDQTEQEVEERCKIVTLLHNADNSLIHAYARLCDSNNYFKMVPLTCDRVDTKLIKHLISLGADISFDDGSQMTPVVCMTAYLDPRQFHEMIQFIINLGKGKCLVPDGNCYTALHAAVLRFEVEEDTVKLFQEYGFQINGDGDPLLHAALKSRRSPDFIRMLIRRGADANLKDAYKCSTLHYAVKTPRTMQKEVIEVLLEHGANVNRVDGLGHTPLWHALNGNSRYQIKPETVKLLKHYGGQSK